MASNTMKNWKHIAEASGLDIPAADLDKISPLLDALELTFRPLVDALDEENESSLIFSLRGDRQ